MKISKKIILINLVFFISLLIFSINSKVLGEEKIKEIKDFNYIPIKEYVFIENDNGDFDIDDNGNKYFYYKMLQQEGDAIEIIYKDGTKHIYKYKDIYGDGDACHYVDSDGQYLWYKDSNNNYKEPKFSHNQWKEHWKVGTNNYATIEIFGIKKKIPITIIESPVKAFKYIPVSNICYTSNATWHHMWIWNEKKQKSIEEEYVSFERGIPMKLGDKIEVEYKDNTKKTYTYMKKDWTYFYDDEGNAIEFDVRIEEDEHKYETGTTKNGNVIDKCCFCGKVGSCYPKTIKLSNKTFKYNKKVQVPKVIIKNGKGKTVKKSNYTITYSNKKSKKVGEYIITIKFKGDYKGKKVLKYKIKPKGVSIKKIKAAKKEFKVKWYKNTTQTTGYEIQYSRNSNFEYENKTIPFIGTTLGSTMVFL